MSEGSAVTLFVTLLGLAGTIGGVWIGRLMERSNEVTKWRRDRRLEAYADVLATCHAVLNEGTKAWLMKEPTPQAMTQNAVLMTKVDEMYRAGDKASLVGSGEIDSVIRRLTDYYCQEIGRRAINIPKPSEDEWHKLVRDGGDLYGTFTVLARKDLDIAPEKATAKERIPRDDQIMLDIK